jgi:hypothetical protein
LNYNWDLVDKLGWGSGISFPATYQVGSKFLKTDEKKVYENTGTEGTPVWTLVLDGSNAGVAVDEKVKVSINDTTEGYLLDKIVAANAEITVTEQNDGSNETIAIGLGPHTHTESDITDLVHDAVSIQGITVDNTDIADGKVLQYNSTSGNLEYEVIVAADEKVKVSPDDTTPGYLDEKIVAGSAAIVLTELGDGNNESLSIDLGPHTHTASDVTDFDTEVSNNTDVAANTAARHNRVHGISDVADHTGVVGAVEDNLVSFDANGLPKDSGVSASSAFTPSAHASTHLPAGSDPLTTASPVSLGLALATGTAESFSRSDHVHDVINLTHTTESPRTTSTATTLNGHYVLTSSSTVVQYITGTETGFTVHLPDATTLTNGWKFEVYNTSSQQIIVEYDDETDLVTLASSAVGFFILQDNSTSNGVWLFQGELIGTDVGIVSYTATSSTLFSTTSSTDVIISDMTVLPMAGKYAIWYHSSSDIVSNNNDAYVTIYQNGTPVSDSVRRIRTSVNTMYSTQSTMTIADFNGSQNCNVYVRTSSGTLNVNDRSLIMIRIGA